MRKIYHDQINNLCEKLQAAEAVIGVTDTIIEDWSKINTLQYLRYLSAALRNRNKEIKQLKLRIAHLEGAL